MGEPRSVYRPVPQAGEPGWSVHRPETVTERGGPALGPDGRYDPGRR